MTGPFLLFFGINSPADSIYLHTLNTAQRWGGGGGNGVSNFFFPPAVRSSGAGIQLPLNFGQRKARRGFTSAPTASEHKGRNRRLHRPAASPSGPQRPRWGRGLGACSSRTKGTASVPLGCRRPPAPPPPSRSPAALPRRRHPPPRPTLRGTRRCPTPAALAPRRPSAKFSPTLPSRRGEASAATAGYCHRSRSPRAESGVPSPRQRSTVRGTARYRARHGTARGPPAPPRTLTGAALSSLARPVQSLEAPAAPARRWGGGGTGRDGAARSRRPGEGPRRPARRASAAHAEPLSQFSQSPNCLLERRKGADGAFAPKNC